ncbi:cilia- and flagella-associated protein 161-like [Macrosteles quadrilineatus]|uniref:cilia- and flagella-associated protein 161-like n=1 Tax=Macrosteles quadrilineatus TaxID=74068 RepID=UPI0023E2AAAC|nr:cilia- and flagella-associated protein 161-like [Macrosteles quadrilineatus]
MSVNHHGKKQEDKTEALGPKYCSKVRMGNWNEDVILQEENIKYFLRKKEKGELMIQKTRETLSNILKEVQLLLPEFYLCYGQTCQVVNLSVCHPRAPQGLALAGVVGPREVDECRHFLDGSLVAGSPMTSPVVRNCFRISSPENTDLNGQQLKFGEPFALSTVESPYKMPLWVESEVPHLHSVLGKSKHPLLRLTSYKNIYSLWRALPLEPSDREDLLGTPVPANEPLIISHVASNKNLSVEPDFWFTTYLGAECEVTVNTDLNIYRRETSNNIWMLVTNRPKEER